MQYSMRWSNRLLPISGNVQRLRKEKNKPQLDLVLEMGLKSTSFYSKCENLKDNHHFNLEHIYKIAVALNVDITEFFKRYYLRGKF